MQEPKKPKNEQMRIKALKNLNLLDTETEDRFDIITKMATQIFDMPISTISIIDKDREWYKSCVGVMKNEIDRAVSFCGHTILGEKTFIVHDTHKDERFADNPMVIGTPYIRFYAGYPIKTLEGHNIGAFCVKDTKPRDFLPEEHDRLQLLAHLVELEINFPEESKKLYELHSD